jgi:farnesol kinase
MPSVVEDPSPTPAQSLAPVENSLPATKSESEFYRKLLHMLPGVLPFGLALIPHDDPPDWVAMTLVVGITLLFTGVYVFFRSHVSRPEESNFFSSALSYPAMVVGTLVVFPSHAEFAMVVVILIGLGDGFAYVCGKRFGRKKLPWNREKSWAGTIGFIVFSAPLASLAFWMEAQNPDVPYLLALSCCTIAAVAAALAESWPTELTDNLRVGLTAAIAISGSYFLLAPYWI